MKLLIYLLLLLTMPLAAQGKTDEKTLLDCIDKMIENDQYYQGIKEKELKHLRSGKLMKLKTTKPDYCFLTAYIMPIVLTATTQHTHI